MPYSLNGCGTRYYGSRDKSPDGSYVTTMWVTFVFVPVIPLRSYRVRPTGKGSNYVVYSNQSYLTRRVPLCWRQIGNVYFVVAPILALAIYFGWKYGQESGAPPVELQQSSDAAPFDPKVDNPAFDTFHPSMKKQTDGDGPCGKIFSIEDKKNFARLDLLFAMSKIVNEAGFTKDEFEQLDRSKMEESAFEAYGFAYLAWDKPGANTEADYERIIDNAVNATKAKISSQDEAVAVQKFRAMMLKAYDLGLYDANRNPCPF